jgi:hypothetical protein
MKPFFAYLLTALVLQIFSRELLVVDFTLNRATITARFCVNKARPARNYDGKCYFAKKLKQQKDRENKAHSPQPSKRAAGNAARLRVLVPGSYAAPLSAVFHPPLG